MTTSLADNFSVAAIPTSVQFIRYMPFFSSRVIGSNKYSSPVTAVNL